MVKVMEERKRRYRCPSCGKEFESETQSEKCPFCRGKVLILLEGPSLRRPAGCAAAG